MSATLLGGPWWSERRPGRRSGALWGSTWQVKGQGQGQPSPGGRAKAEGEGRPSASSLSPVSVAVRPGGLKGAAHRLRRRPAAALDPASARARRGCHAPLLGLGRWGGNDERRNCGVGGDRSGARPRAAAWIRSGLEAWASAAAERWRSSPAPSAALSACAASSPAERAGPGAHRGASEARPGSPGRPTAGVRSAAEQPAC